MRTSIKLGYGVGQLSSGIKNTAFSIFLFFFYNQVLGLSGSLAGLASLLALVVDAVTDPMVGQMSDRFKSRWGRRHPFMLVGAVPFGLAMVMLFDPPESLQGYSLFGWMLGWAVCVRLLLTLFFVPHLSLGAEMVRDYHDRTSLISYRIFFQSAGALLTAMVGFVLFFPPSDAFPNGMLNAASYPGFGVFAGVAGSIAMLWSVFSTRSTIADLMEPVPDPNATTPLLGFVTVFKTLRQNAFRVLFLSMLIFMTIAGLTQTLIVYSGTYLFGFEPKHLALVASSPIIGILFGPWVAQHMSRKYDKKKTFMLCIFIGALFGFAPPIAFLGGILEAMSLETRIGFVYLANGLSQIFFIALVIIIDSMLSDTIDQHELDTGRREEGLYFAAGSLATKASYGLGSFIAGIALDIIRFPRGVNPGEVPTEALLKLATFAGPISMLLMLLAIIVIKAYPLNQKRHEKILSDIQAMKTAAT